MIYANVPSSIQLNSLFLFEVYGVIHFMVLFLVYFFCDLETALVRASPYSLLLSLSRGRVTLHRTIGEAKVTVSFFALFSQEPFRESFRCIHTPCCICSVPFWHKEKPLLFPLSIPHPFFPSQRSIAVHFFVVHTKVLY